MNDSIYRLCYASTATEKCTSLQADNIAQSSCRKTVELDITGTVFFGSGYFLQFLGDKHGSINTLYNKLLHEECMSSQIENILQVSSKHNVQLGITGVLFFGNGYFLQFLEGRRDNINVLYRRLLQDDRHANLQILDFQQVDGRYFEAWSMKYIPFPHLIDKVLQATGLEEFNPYLLNANAVNALAETFRDHYQYEIK